jgi:hypothetical protein
VTGVRGNDGLAGGGQVGRINFSHRFVFWFAFRERKEVLAGFFRSLLGQRVASLLSPFDLRFVFHFEMVGTGAFKILRIGYVRYQYPKQDYDNQNQNLSKAAL